MIQLRLRAAWAARREAAAQAARRKAEEEVARELAAEELARRVAAEEEARIVAAQRAEDVAETVEGLVRAIIGRAAAGDLIGSSFICHLPDDRLIVHLFICPS